MASDESRAVASPAIADREALDRLEDLVASRRSFLAGVGLGAVAGAAGAAVLAREAAGFQALATLAAGETAPAPARYFLPAVDGAGEGLVMSVEVEFAAGDGGLFVNLEGVEVRHDVQLAIREAVAMAAELTGATLDGTDVRVSFRTDESGVVALRGKSWEAGLVVTLVAGLRRATLTRETLVTGVVDSAGTLLPVGAVEAKARTAAAFGARELVVPAGQAEDVSVADIDVVGAATIGEVVERVLG